MHVDEAIAPLLENQGLVERDHLLHTLARVQNSVVFIEGESGCGSTTLMRQFAQKYRDQTFALHLRPASKFSYSPDYLRLVLAEQFAEFLRVELSSTQGVDESEYKSLLLALRRRKTGSTVYFVVDGLQQVPAHDRKTLEEIFAQVLPVGIDGFRFLIVGAQESFKSLIGKISSKSYVIADFSIPESEILFSGTNICHEELKAIHKLCNGLPGRLSAVRRMLESGNSVQSIMAAEPSSYLEFIEIELAPIDLLSESECFAVAAVTFSKQALSVENLNFVFGLQKEGLESLLESCGFLCIDENSHVRFSTETHRRAAERRLQQHRNAVLDVQIEYLSRNPNVPDAIEFLPAYMLAQQKQQNIIDLLQPEHYEKLLTNTKSLARLRSRAGMGAKSALELNKARELFQFSLQRSIFLDLATADDSQAQVAALVGLGKSDRALDLASQAASTEVRLRMLAEYARGVKERGDQVDPKVLDYIRELCASVDLSESAEEAERLAENIAAFDPDLAITILDKPLLSGETGSSRDRALAKFSIATTLSGAENSKAILEKASGQITDDKLRALVSVVADFYDDFSIDAVRRLIEPMSPSRRVYFLRGILIAEKTSAIALDILDLALNELISNTSYVPKLKDFADLAVGLNSDHADQHRVNELIRRIDSQLGLVQEAGSTSDFVRVQMRLAQGEAKGNPSAARDRVLAAFDVVSAATLPEVKVESLAVMLNLLKDLQGREELDSDYGLSQIIHQELSSQIDVLLFQTASHFDSLRGALTAIARGDSEKACEIAMQLNTQSSRDSALRVIAQTIVLKPYTAVEADNVVSILDALSCSDARLLCCRSMVRAVPMSTDSRGWAAGLTVFLMSFPPDRHSCSTALELAKSQVKYLQAADVSLVDYVESGAEALSDSSGRVAMLYSLVAIAASTDMQRANELYERTVRLQNSFAISAPAASRTVRTCLSLLLRVMRALAKFDELSPDYLVRFARICESLEDVVAKIAHLSDLATKAWCEGKLDLCRQIMGEYVRPAVDSCQIGSVRHRHARMAAFIPNFLSRGAVSLAALSDQTRAARDDVLESTAYVILRKVSDGDYWAGDDNDLVVSMEEAEDVLLLISEMRTDTSIYSAITALCKAITSKTSRRKISQQQRADLFNRLSTIIGNLLPDSDNIRHGGYSIVARARVNTLVDTKMPAWNSLIAEAALLPNSSDGILVEIEIVECIPERFKAERRVVLARLKDLIPQIPSAYDRYWRTQSFAEVAKDIDPPAARVALNTAFAVTFELDSRRDAQNYRRNILNIAEMMDPKFADSIAESIDDDPARASARADMERENKINRTKKAISSLKRADSSQVEVRSDVLPSAAWKAVGALVSGKSAPVSPELLDRYVEASGHWDLHDAFPVLSWYVENLSRRLNRQVDVSAKLSPLAETILLSTELAISVIAQVSGKQKLAVFHTADNSAGLIMRPGNYDEVRSYLTQWVRDHAMSSGEVILCDPYFGVSDLELLKLIGAEMPGIEIRILTSVKAMKAICTDELDAAWRKISDQDPPICSFVMVRTDVDERSPIHDRWLLLEDAGLRIGTSVGGICSRLSEISEVDTDRAHSLRSTLMPYLAQRRLIDGKRMEYSVESLG
jgi:hypothetical protein